MTQPGYSSSHIFPHPGHRVRSSVRDDPLVPDQTHSAPIKHRSSCFTYITVFPLQVISPTLVTNHSHRRSHYFPRPTLLIDSPYSSFPHDVIPYCSSLIFLIFPSFVCHHSRTITRSVRSACPKPFPLYSGRVLPVFPQTLLTQKYP